MKDIHSLALSFVFAAKGFWWMVTHERNFRIHLTCVAYMLFFLLRYDFFEVNRTQIAVLLLAAGLVIAGEMYNTGIEKADDSVSVEIRKTIAVSKDTAAGGVLVSAVAAVGVGIAILWQPEAFRQLFAYYAGHPVSLALFAVSLVAALTFIFAFGRKNESVPPKDGDDKPEV